MSEDPKCPLCDTIVNQFDRIPSRNMDYYYCSRCGKYYLSDLFHISSKSLNDKAILSYWIQNNQKYNNHPKISIDLFEKIISEIKLPNVKEQANNIIQYLGDSSSAYGATIEINLNDIIALIGSTDKESLLFIFDYLNEKNLVNIVKPQVSKSTLMNKDVLIVRCYLSHLGWEKFAELQTPSNIGKQVFMAMKYNNDVLEKIYKKNIKEAVKQTGFEIQLLRDALKAGSIDDQLRVQIRKAKFLLVDLTDNNNGAYWEAGFAEGLNKPVIYLCEKNKFVDFQTHFDTNHLTTVLWHPVSIEEDMKNLKAVIRNTFPLESVLEDNDSDVNIYK